MSPYIVLNCGERVNHEKYTVHTSLILPSLFLSHCRTPMYAGHSDLFQSVAHHCVGASRICEWYTRDLKIAAYTLLHELEVGVYGDIPGPVKIDEQRVVEKEFRNQLLANRVGSQPTVSEWNKVEFFDKLEQAAATRILGFPEPIHENIWQGCTPQLQVKSLQIVANLMLQYPPALQLVKDSPLQQEMSNSLASYLLK